MTLVRVAIAALTVLLVPTTSFGQNYPSKPVRIVVPYPVGGAVDVMTRLVADRMASDLGQPVIVENRPGANANLGPEAVARSNPDGYTLLASATYLIANPLVESSLRWKPADFVPVARFTVAPNVLVVPANLPASTLQEFVAAAKSKPGSMNYGESGPGAPQTMAIEMLKTVTGIQMQSVMYKGGPPVIADLVNETLAMSVLPLNVAMATLGSGRIKALASTSNARSPLLPDVPTMTESGYPDVTVVSWYGLHVPVGTPPNVIARLSSAVAAATADEKVKARTASVGGEISFLDATAFERLLRDDNLRWQKFVQTIRAR